MNRRLLQFTVLLLLCITANGCEQPEAPPAPVRPGPISWKPSTDSLPVTVMALGTTPRGDIVAATDSGVYISANKGDSWRQIREGITQDIAINERGEIYIIQKQTLYRSGDYGGTWQAILADDFLSGNVILAGNDGTILAAGNGIVFHSTSNGTSWRAIDTLHTGYGFFRAFLARGVSTLFIVTNAFGVLRSTDKGASWHNVGVDTLGSVVSMINGLAGEIYATGRDDYGDPTGMKSAVWRSTDNGSSWRRMGTGIEDYWTYKMAVNKHGHLYVATDKGMLRSGDNGISWEEVSNGLGGHRTLSVAVDREGYIYAGTYRSGIYRTLKPTH